MIKVIRKFIICFGIVSLLLSILLILPQVEGKVLFPEKNHALLAINDRSNGVVGKGLLVNLLQKFNTFLESKADNPEQTFIFMMLFWMLLFSFGVAAMLPLFFIAAAPLVIYALIYAAFMTVYSFGIFAPIVIVLYVLHTIFPNSELVNLTVNITLSILLLPIILGGAIFIPLALPLVGVMMLMVGWLVLSFQIVYTLWFGPSSLLNQNF